MKRTAKIVVCSAVVLLAMPACRTTPTQDGAMAGAAVGAGAGAIIGHQSGKQGEGALIGAGIGAITGALIGDRVDERRDRRTAEPRRVEPAPAPAPAPATTERREEGHYETRVVVSESGERYEERVWVPHNRN